MNWKQFLQQSSYAISLNTFALDCNAPPEGIGPDAAESNLQCAEQERAAADHALNNTYKCCSRTSKMIRSSSAWRELRLWPHSVRGARSETQNASFVRV
ncbi:hypothetical protein [Paraburkholderia tropica]|uniref:hypothetical protein n=1 Tax=Paraburkholderia tropica TaxID=92647 RepID=UPI002AB76A1A|nr:hypothetical protein [Paraburkholderia tropica]